MVYRTAACDELQINCASPGVKTMVLSLQPREQSRAFVLAARHCSTHLFILCFCLQIDFLQFNQFILVRSQHVLQKVPAKALQNHSLPMMFVFGRPHSGQTGPKLVPEESLRQTTFQLDAGNTKPLHTIESLLSALWTTANTSS